MLWKNPHFLDQNKSTSLYNTTSKNIFREHTKMAPVTTQSGTEKNHQNTGYWHLTINKEIHRFILKNRTAHFKLQSVWSKKWVVLQIEMLLGKTDIQLTSGLFQEAWKSSKLLIIFYLREEKCNESKELQIISKIKWYDVEIKACGFFTFSHTRTFIFKLFVE